MSDCQHTYGDPGMHVDFCHAYAWAWTCKKCGELKVTINPRDRSDLMLRRDKDCDGCKAITVGQMPKDLDELREGVVALDEIARLRLAATDADRSET